MQRNDRTITDGGVRPRHSATFNLLLALCVAALAGLSLPVAAQTGAVIRVNAGGPAYTDSVGHLWSADTGYNSGSTYSSNPLRRWWAWVRPAAQPTNTILLDVSSR